MPNCETFTRPEQSEAGFSCRALKRLIKLTRAEDGLVHIPIKEGAALYVCFPMPADDFLNGLLELPRWLAPNPSAAFAWNISSNSMRGAGIFDHELAVADRSLKPGHGSVVIAIVDGTMSLKRPIIEGKVVRLAFDNSERRSSSFSTGRTGCF